VVQLCNYNYNYNNDNEVFNFYAKKETQKFVFAWPIAMNAKWTWPGRNYCPAIAPHCTRLHHSLCKCLESFFCCFCFCVKLNCLFVLCLVLLSRFICLFARFVSCLLSSSVVCPHCRRCLRCFLSSFASKHFEIKLSISVNTESRRKHNSKPRSLQTPNFQLELMLTFLSYFQLLIYSSLGKGI